MAVDDFDTSRNRECFECHRKGFDDGDWQFFGYDDEAELYICPGCQSISQYVMDDLLVRDAQLRIGADDAGHDGCLGEGHSGSSLTCEHPFCIAERMPPS